MPISGVNPTPRTTAVYAADPALPRRPQDSLPSRLLSFGRTRLALASSYRLLLSHPASGFPTGFIAGIRRAGDTSVICGPASPWLRDTASSEGQGATHENHRGYAGDCELP